jgi:hypothetical protein
MANYSKIEFPYARPIADALLSDETFRQWFLADTKFAPIAANVLPLPDDQARLRTTPSARKWWWFNHYCTKDSRCSCKIGTGLETDILIVFAAPDNYRFAVHVEVKPPGEKLKEGQAETYPRRAECWANPSTRQRSVLAHKDFVTILVCGENLRSDSRRDYFSGTRFHQDIEQRLSPYPDPIDLRTLE